MGERVPEPELAVTCGDELQVHAGAQRPRDRATVQARHRAEQRLLEPAPQDRGRGDHQPGVPVKGVHAPGDRPREPAVERSDGACIREGQARSGKSEVDRQNGWPAGSANTR
jgi:hypothetical protein